MRRKPEPGSAVEEITPGSAAGQAVLDRIVVADTAPAQRASMLEQLETFTDARVERYWQLVGIINGRPPFPSAVPAFEWVIAALRAHARPDIRWSWLGQRCAADQVYRCAGGGELELPVNLAARAGSAGGLVKSNDKKRAGWRPRALRPGRGCQAKNW